MAGPPPLLALRGATVTFGGDALFDGIDMALAAGDRACLIGRNGSGKSTLLKVLAGTVALDGGTRFVQPGTRITVLAQDPDVGGFDSVGAYVAAGLPADEAHDTFRVDAALAEVGLDADATPEALSGGEAKRAALARALAGRPDVLLLDEPTNHLDLPTIEWLERRLADLRGALLLISHDRAFLTALSRRMLWLDRGRMRALDRGFAAFDAWADAVLEEEAQERHRMDRRIESETRWLRQGLTARRKRNMGRVRALQALREERRQRPPPGGVARLDPTAAARGGTLVLEATDICKSVPGPDGPRCLVRGFSTRILRGDRVGVIGPNGAGKTTLVRILIGALPPDGGTVRAGSGIEIAYFDQRRESLDPDATLRRVLAPGGGDQVTVGGQPRHVAGYLKDFLFDPSRLDSPVKSLSGGERNRLLLARLFARPSNLLVLDEPTNDLDMETLDLLEEVLADYAGTLILVSHDRDFLDRLAGSIIAVGGGGSVAEYAGGYSDYLRQRPSPAEPKRSADPARRPPPARQTTDAPPSAPRKLTYGQQRALDALPGEIDRLTAEIADLKDGLSDPDLYRRDPALFHANTERLAKAEAALTEAEERWLDLAALAETLARP
ncbi:MAG: ATP-binding cassette domain-containing protein [Inquilinaceae bacterium]